jgi:hypothetical protein
MFIFITMTQYYNDGLPILNSGMVMNGKHLFKTYFEHTKASIYYLKFHDSKDITKFGWMTLKITRTQKHSRTNTQNDKENIYGIKLMLKLAVW